MSVFDVDASDISFLTLVTTPSVSFVSSSSGVVGSARVYSRQSDVLKDIPIQSAFVNSTADDSNPMIALWTAKSAAISGSKDISSEVTHYIKDVHALTPSVGMKLSVDIVRNEPSYSFTQATAEKNYVRNVLMKHEKSRYPGMDWAFTNYNSLNFYTASCVPSDAALLYPNVSNVYQLTGSFAFDFYINVRNGQDPGTAYLPGTVFHLSSSYALSVVSGSSQGNGHVSDGFRLLLQLSSSTDLAPGTAHVHALASSGMNYISNDNALKMNTWHHVTVTWGTLNTNNGVGAFLVDGVRQGEFSLQQNSINTNKDADVLTVGNYYSGTNHGSSLQALFFAKDVAARDGVEELVSETGVNEPAAYAFTNPLRAEVHDLCIMNRFLTDAETSLESLEIDPTAVFYVPPFFVQDTPIRRSVNGFGGILQTPFFEVDGNTTEPFNVAMSFGVGGHYVNLENFVKDFASEQFPRLHKLSGTAITTTESTPESADWFMYRDPFVRYRNTLVLPCDDGNFLPKFTGILSKEVDRDRYVDDLGAVDYSLVNMTEMISSVSIGSWYSRQTLNSVAPTDFSKDVYGFTPEDVTAPPGPTYMSYVNAVKKAIASGQFTADIQQGAPLVIVQRTKDVSSNEVTMFDISNLYYGDKIRPGTLTIKSVLTGSGGAVNVSLADNAQGDLYRSDCLSPQAQWTSHGNVFYEDGIVLVKNCLLQHFGSDGYELTFKGQRDVYVLRLESIAPRNAVNVSTNPNFLPVSASVSPTDTDSSFVYVSGVNYHDSDFNVVLKSQFAQPIMKRNGSRILFVSKIDF